MQLLRRHLAHTDLPIYHTVSADLLWPSFPSLSSVLFFNLVATRLLSVLAVLGLRHIGPCLYLLATHKYIWGGFS